MRRLSTNLKYVVVCTVLILTMGCKPKLQLGSTLIILPDPTSKEFKFTASVKNTGQKTSGEVYLLVIVKWAQPYLHCEGIGVPSVSSYSQKVYTIPALPPNGTTR
jgi:hypothetical protein